MPRRNWAAPATLLLPILGLEEAAIWDRLRAGLIRVFKRAGKFDADTVIIYGSCREPSAAARPGQALLVTRPIGYYQVLCFPSWYYHSLRIHEWD